MTTSDDKLLQLISKLQEPIPQYVLGCIPAIATIGAAPDNGLGKKTLWFLRCLGCPFTGLFYTMNVNGDTIGLSTYWLKASQFTLVNDNEKFEQMSYRPIGHRAMKIIEDQDRAVHQLLEECIAEASILDRLSSLASTYYIFLGIFAGITRAVHEIDSCTVEDWPYLPLALAWTLPAIYKRVTKGKLVVKDPRVLLGDNNDEENNNNSQALSVFVKELSHEDKSAQDAHILITLILFSTIIPWITVLLAYFTRPVGYGCRSKYLTVICSTWTLNNIVAYISHLVGEKFVTSNRLIHAWFCLSGAIIGVLLILLALLSYTPSWWVHLFGASCVVCPGKNR